jgi:hypothetical protein
MKLTCDKFFARAAWACDQHVGCEASDPPNLVTQVTDIRRLARNASEASTLCPRELAHEIPAFRPALAVKDVAERTESQQRLSCCPGISRQYGRAKLI